MRDTRMIPVLVAYDGFPPGPLPWVKGHEHNVLVPANSPEPDLRTAALVEMASARKFSQFVFTSFRILRISKPGAIQ